MILKTIKNAPDYEVSDCGDIFSKERIVIRKNGRPYKVKRTQLKPGTDGGGYSRVAIIINGSLITLKVHRVVCEAFIGKSDLDVNHKDGNKKNNNISNLEYCNRSENVLHAFRNNLATPMRGSRNPKAKIDEIKALTIKTLLMTGIGPCKVSRDFNVSINITKDISIGKTWNHI